jgi:hypothetical protein
LIGYTSWEQLGRYYSITYKNKITRLYTSVNFLTKSNKKFMETFLRLNKYSKPLKIKSKSFDVELTEYPLNVEGTTEKSNDRSHCLPILFKMYKDGKFTESLVN